MFVTVKWVWNPNEWGWYESTIQSSGTMHCPELGAACMPLMMTQLYIPYEWGRELVNNMQSADDDDEKTPVGDQWQDGIDDERDGQNKREGKKWRRETETVVDIQRESGGESMRLGMTKMIELNKWMAGEREKKSHREDERRIWGINRVR